MKNLIKILTIIILFSACSTTKQVNRQITKEEKRLTTDSTAVSKKQTFESTQKTDSSTITITEHIETNYYQIPDTGKTIPVSQKQVPDVNKMIPVSQKIDRKIVEKKAIKEQSTKTETENSNVNLNKKATDNQNKKEVTKDVKRPFVPWWVYVILIVIAAALLYIYKNKIVFIIRELIWLLK